MEAPSSSPEPPYDISVKLSPRSLPKQKFNEEDDERLKAIIKDLGTKSWADVSKAMGNRNPRQCKERWENYLNPHINNDPWTKEEDDLLILKQKEIGSRWVTISHFFNRRTDAAVKNRWQMLARRQKKIKHLLEKQKNGGKSKSRSSEKVKSKSSTQKKQATKAAAKQVNSNEDITFTVDFTAPREFLPDLSIPGETEWDAQVYPAGFQQNDLFVDFL